MTNNELSRCFKAVENSISDRQSADRIQDLYIRLKSASGMLQSVLQECVAIYDEIEQTANSRLVEPVSVQPDASSESIQEFAETMLNGLGKTLLDGARKITDSGIPWYAEEEPIEAFIAGKWTPAWHMLNDGETAVVCLEYLGSHRIEVPMSDIRRPMEQA